MTKLNVFSPTSCRSFKTYREGTPKLTELGVYNSVKCTPKQLV